MDEFSDLYYDPTPLREHMKDAQQEKENDEPSSSNAPQRQQHEAVNSPRITRTSSMQGGMNPQLAQAQMFGNPQAMASPRHGFPGATPGMGGPYGSMQAIPPAQFYGGGDVPVSPMQRGPGPGMSMNPAMAMGGGMTMNPAMGMGGMPPDSSLSPEVRRRVTRGMSLDEFGGMH